MMRKLFMSALILISVTERRVGHSVYILFSFSTPSSLLYGRGCIAVLTLLGSGGLLCYRGKWAGRVFLLFSFIFFLCPPPVLQFE